MAYMPTTPQTSTSQALGIRLSLIMLMTVQGTTPKNSSIDVQHCTALTVISFAFIQLSITAPSFAILMQRLGRHALGGNIALDGGQLRLHGVVVVLQPLDAAKDLREVDGVHVDAWRLPAASRCSGRC